MSNSKEPGSVSKTRGIYCCVKNCKESTTKSGLQFFRVIRAKNESQTNAWTLAINRLENDGKLWRPKAGTRICAKHFVSGKPSCDPNNPDYIPSLHMSNNFVSEQSMPRQTQVS